MLICNKIIVVICVVIRIFCILVGKSVELKCNLISLYFES